MRPAAKIVTISPNINISRQVSLLWGVQSLTKKDMMSISKEIIKKLNLLKKMILL